MVATKGKKAKEALIVAAGVGGAALATGASVPVAAIQAAGAVAHQAYGIFKDVYHGRATNMLLETAQTLDMPVDEVAGLLKENANESWTRQTVFEAYRSLMDVLDDAVVPALGRLLARQIGAAQKPDRFCRSVASALSKMTADELLTLQQLLAEGVRFAEAQGNKHSVEMHLDEERRVNFLSEFSRPGPETFLIQSPLLVLNILRGSQVLGDRAEEQGNGGFGGPHIGTLPLDLCRALMMIVGPPSVTAPSEPYKEKNLDDTSTE